VLLNDCESDWLSLKLILANYATNSSIVVAVQWIRRDSMFRRNCQPLLIRPIIVLLNFLNNFCLKCYHYRWVTILLQFLTKIFLTIYSGSWLRQWVNGAVGTAPASSLPSSDSACSFQLRRLLQLRASSSFFWNSDAQGTPPSSAKRHHNDNGGERTLALSNWYIRWSSTSNSQSCLAIHCSFWDSSIYTVLRLFSCLLCRLVDLRASLLSSGWTGNSAIIGEEASQWYWWAITPMLSKWYVIVTFMVTEWSRILDRH